MKRLKTLQKKNQVDALSRTSFKQISELPLYILTMGAVAVAKWGYEGNLRLAVNQTIGFKAFGNFSLPKFGSIFHLVGTIKENSIQICNCF